MITSIRLVNFKNFADETLRVGPFTVIIGANASGKSNIRDAFRFLHGIGRGYSLAEIIGGKYGPGGQREWEPIRGATNEIIRYGQSSFTLEIGLKLNGEAVHYSIEIGQGRTGSGGFQVTCEEMKAGQMTMYSASQDSYETLWVNSVKGYLGQQFRLDSTQPALTQDIPLDNKGTHLFNDQIFSDLRSVLSNLRFWDLMPMHIREPSVPGATMLGDSGENLPTVLKEICADPKRQEILTSWVHELTPMDVQRFEFPRDPSGRVHLMLCETNGRQVSADSASDGTLRFLAMLATLLGENSWGLHFFEEIDTGIHPARQWLLLELIEKQAAKGDVQIITTTHAPDLLTFVNDSTFENMSVVCRLEDSSDAIIRRVAELPNARELRKSQGLGRLLIEGWIETALAFTENYDEAEGNGE